MTFTAHLERLWLKYRLRNEYYELEWATAAEIAALYRGNVMTLKDKLKELGHGDIDPEDITEQFELWLVVALLIACGLVGVAFTAYRQALINLMGA